MKVTLEKRVDGSFVPPNPEAALQLKSVKIGEAINVEYSKVRNYKFLKKYMVLMHFAFDQWETAEGQPEKNFDRFREDITILSGYYHEVPRIDGTTRVEARSISFGKMDADTFDQLYNKTQDVLIKYILKTYTPDDLNDVLTHIASF